MNRLSYDLKQIRDRTFVREIDFHWEIDSTNSHALHCAEQEDLTTPLLVLAEQQTAGRGRGKNLWWSAPGSITFSLVIPVQDISGNRRPQISLLVGLAICQAVEQFAPQADLGLKWPNDVYLDGRKLAGILIELPTTQPPTATIGVGINVNNSFQSAPPELVTTGIALVDAIESEVDLTDLLITCLQQIERRFAELVQHTGDLIDQCRAYHILQDRTIEIETHDGPERGRCLGIDDDGALILETPTGVQRFLAGVVTSF